MSLVVKFQVDVVAVKDHGFTLSPSVDPRSSEVVQWEWLVRGFDLVALSGSPLTAQLMLAMVLNDIYPETGAVEDIDKDAVIQLAESMTFVANA